LYNGFEVNNKEICRVIGKLYQEEVDYDETFNPITRFQTFKVAKQRMLSPSDGCRDIDLFLFIVSCPRMTLLFMYISRNTYFVPIPVCGLLPPYAI
jgi:hypothetical protein